MKTRRSGSRHPLLLYRRMMDRLWTATLLLGLLLTAAWGWLLVSDTPLIQSQDSLWLMAGSLVVLSFTLFAFLGRYVAYVQPRRDHLRLVTPFLSLRISYRRVRSVHPADFQQLFPPSEATWAQRRFLAPFFGKTAVVVELTNYPLSPTLLRFFLAPQMFSHQTTGLIFLVPDWMALSTEIDSLSGAWLQQVKSRHLAAPGRLR